MREQLVPGVPHLEHPLRQPHVDLRRFTLDHDLADRRDLDHGARQQRLRPVHRRIEPLNQLGTCVRPLGDELKRGLIVQRRLFRFAHPSVVQNLKPRHIARAQRQLPQRRPRHHQHSARRPVERPARGEPVLLLKRFQRRRRLRAAHPVDRAAGKSPPRELDLRFQPIRHRLRIGQRCGRGPLRFCDRFRCRFLGHRLGDDHRRRRQNESHHRLGTHRARHQPRPRDRPEKPENGARAMLHDSNRARAPISCQVRR